MKKEIIYILIASILLISVVTAEIEILPSTADNKIINLIPSVDDVTSFLGLSDTPNSYAGQGGSCIAVNIGETGLEFVSCGAGGTGDITSVLGDIYITNGSSTGSVNLEFNETQLNKTIDARATGNSSWNQSLANTLYASITWNYNQTTPAITYTNSIVTLYNNTWSSTYNSTYAQWAYNQTTPFTNWLATFAFNYNQTTPAITDINSRFWNRTQSYNKSEIDSFNASWSSTYNSTYAQWAYNQTVSTTTSIGFYINYTPITTTGNITNGTLKGYLAANAICNTYYSGSHMCQTDEILNSINRNQTNTNFTATFRITEGAPGYLANANDCDGLTSPAGADLGAIWVGSTTHLSTYGSASLVSCSAARAIGCCK